MSSASVRTKVCKESPFSNRIVIQLPRKTKFPDWCSYQSMEHIISFVAPVHLDINIYGIILCANTSSDYESSIFIPKMYNKTKSTSHRFLTKDTRHHFVTNFSDDCMRVMCCPLDNTTLLVEPGDSVVLKFPQGLVSSCGLRLIYESDVVNCKLVIQTIAEPYSLGNSPLP